MKLLHLLSAFRYCAPYSIEHVDDEMLCAFPCFIYDIHTDFVSAFQIIHVFCVFETDLFDWFVANGMIKDIKDMVYFDHPIHNATMKNLFRDSKSFETS